MNQLSDTFNNNYKRYIYFIPLLVLCSSLVLMTGIHCALWLFYPEVYLDFISYETLFLSIIVCVAVSFSIYLFRKTEVNKFSKKLDDKYDGKNRLESHSEFQNKKHPLYEAQRSEAESYFKDSNLKPHTRWKLILPGMIIILVFANILQTRHVIENRENLIIETKKEMDTEEESEPKSEKNEDTEEKKDEMDFFALLNFVEPTPKIQATKLDDIVWKAETESSHPFDSIELSISINGEEKSKVKVKEKYPKNELESIELEDSLLLNQYQLDDFDVVSYHLIADVKMKDGKRESVTSLPQFIQIRPYRVDAVQVKAKGEGGKCEKPGLAERLHAMINKEVDLIQSTYAIKAARLSPDHPLYNEQVQRIYKEQTENRDEAISFVEDYMRLPQEISVSMRSAAMYLSHAIAGLKDCKEAENSKQKSAYLSETTAWQQKGLKDMVYCLKILRKAVMDTTGDMSVQMKPKSFKDDQSYVKLKPKPKENLEKKLEELVKKEEEVLGQCKNQGENPKDDAQQPGGSSEQAGITKELSELSKRKSLPKPLSESIKDAEQKSKGAEAKGSGKKKENQIEEAKSAIEKALQKAQGIADRNALEKLRELQKNLMKAKEDAQSPNGNPYGNLSKAINDSEKAFHEQNLNGKLEHAETFSKLHDKTHRLREEMQEENSEEDIQKHLKKLSELINQVQDKRFGDKKNTEILAEKISHVDDKLSKTKGSDELEGKSLPHLKEFLLSDIKVDLEDIRKIWDRVGQQAGDIQSHLEKMHHMISRSVNSDSGVGQGITKEMITDDFIDVYSQLKVKLINYIESKNSKEIVQNFIKDKAPKKYYKDVAKYFEQLSSPSKEK